MNKMKKKMPILLCVLFVVMLLTACGAMADSSGGYAPEMANSVMTRNTAAYAPSSEPVPLADTGGSYNDSSNYDVSESYSLGDSVYTNSQTSSGSIMPVAAQVTDAMAEKIIYSVYADVETMEFDKTIENVYALMTRHGAFVESSNISGIGYQSQHFGWNEYRYAYFSLRVPKDQLNAMTASLNSLGNVTSRNTSAQNITSQFYDTQSRLNSLLIQEERLLDMLKMAADVPDLITIEERLGDVRYQIESLTTTLKSWQSQVDYSYLTVNIREVEEFTEQVQIHRTYWEQIGDGFMSTIRGTGRFFMNVFKWLVVSAPVLVILAVITLATIFIIKYSIRKAKKKREELLKNAPANVYTNQLAYNYPPMAPQPPPPPQPPEENNKQ